jgi:predicted esterase
MNKTFLDFVALQKSAIDLITQEKYNEAIMNLETAKTFFPDKLDRIGHWLAGIYCIKNNKEKALSELKEVLTKGLYWNPSILTGDSDLSLIQDSKEFAEIIHTCEELYETHKNTSRFIHHILGNTESDTSITALHWKGSNALDFSEQIATDGLRNKYLFSFIQSSQLFSHGCYHWDHYDAAKAEIENSHMELMAGYETSIKKRIIIGASQGADTAITMYFEPNSYYDTALAIVPTLSTLDTIEETLKKHPTTKEKLVIITGDKDYFYQDVLEALPVFERYNIPCQLIVIKGMGHTIPDNFEELLEEIIKEIETY